MYFMTFVIRKDESFEIKYRTSMVQAEYFILSGQFLEPTGVTKNIRSGFFEEG